LPDLPIQEALSICDCLPILCHGSTNVAITSQFGGVGLLYGNHEGSLYIPAQEDQEDNPDAADERIERFLALIRANFEAPESLSDEAIIPVSVLDEDLPHVIGGLELKKTWLTRVINELDQMLQESEIPLSIDYLDGKKGERIIWSIKKREKGNSNI